MSNELSQLSLTSKLFIAEAAMKELPQIELEVKHHFSQGVYGRELYIPKDAVVVGMLHKYQQLNILIKGEVSVLIDGDVQRIKAPYSFVAPSGSKRMFYAHEDSIWMTIHGTDETDVDKIEDYFLAQTEQEYLDFCNQQLRLPL